MYLDTWHSSEMNKQPTPQDPQQPTVDDVAALAGVSKWTVLRAFKEGASISPKTRQEVLEAANSLGFRPNLLARGLKQRKSNLIGVVVDEFSNPHTLKMLNEVTVKLNQRGYITVLLNIDSQDDYRSVLGIATQLQVGGMIFLASIHTDELVTIARQMHHIPSIHVCRNTEVADVEVVNVDGYHAARKLGELLFTQGYQKFGYMKGQKETSQLLRLEGYQDYLSSVGATVSIVLETGRYDRDLAYMVMADYLRNTHAEQRIDALFCEDDVLAFGAIQAIRDFAGGQHIGVVGFDGISEAHSPTWDLTTWDQRSDLQIDEAINRLLNIEKSSGSLWKTGELKLRTSHLRKPTE